MTKRPRAATPHAADIVIVGAGAAGCVLARRLADRSGARILLVEAGAEPNADAAPDGWRLGKPADWGFASEPGASGSAGRLRRGRVLGGTSWLTRFAVRGGAADFDAWAARGNAGWAWADVLPAFRRLEADLQFGSAAWHGSDGPMLVTRYPDLPRSEILGAAVEAFRATGFEIVPDHNDGVSVGVGPMPMSVRDGSRVTTYDAYLPTAERPPNLTIRTGAEVDRVVFAGGEATGARATGVRLVDGTELRSGMVVLAAGTYGSPSILLRSGIGPARHLAEVGVGVRVDLPGVGSNLADHPGVDFDSGWRGRGTRGPLLHSIATFRSERAARDGAPDLMIWVTDPDESDPGFYLDPVLLKPVARGTVRLRSAHGGDPPRITLPAIGESADLDRLADGYRRALEIAQRPEVRALSSEPPPDPPGDRAALARRIAESSYSLPHVVGTCRMGPAPEDGDVVDHLGRVHGVEALHVIDASVIPEPPSGFPHIITIMVAEQLAGRVTP
ncbi:MAG TPA: GMC family oxidoreductase N-terminal domain-containing protein [Candidatus Limnocylindrales bacterium]|nr:GMC family oxidoreductase N-terminal domain-containing protein [Candidatus Limnocylindrales bacterium]